MYIRHGVGMTCASAIRWSFWGYPSVWQLNLKASFEVVLVDYVIIHLEMVRI